jgi:RNA polymerase sigma factor (sigma-70 family)
MTKQAAVLAHAVRKVKAGHLALTDRELLQRFTADGNQEAFATLVNRHSAMVFGVCKRLLPTVPDAEDACQAVFLVLSNKASTNRWQSSVANWLYTTARKVARNARLASSRRARREGAAAVREWVAPADTMTSQELVAALDQELDRLSPRYREPLVLCYLEGLTRDEAAVQLNVPIATLKSQLERGRKKLADALTARGCTLGVALLATAATSAAGASPPQLVELILAATGGSPPSAVAALAKEVAVNGLFANTKLALLALFALAGLGVAYAAWPSEKPARLPAEQRKEERKALPQPAKPKDGEPENVFTYAGRVLDPTGRPLAGAKVYICGLNRGTIEFVEKARSDAGGKFRFHVRRADFHGLADREQGRYVWIGATATGCGPAVRMAGQPKDRENLTLWLAPEQVVTARVVDLQGKPIAGVSLGATIRYARQAADLRPIPFDAPNKAGEWMPNIMPEDPDLPSPVTDRDGRCVLRGLGKDWLYDLYINGPAIAHSKAQLVTRPEKSKLVPGTGLSDNKGNSPRMTQYGSDFTHVAEPSKPLVGVVRDRVSGRPVANARVGKAWVRDGEPTAWTKTDKVGRFRLDGLPRGNHTLTIEPPPPYLRTQYEARADQPGTEAFHCSIELQPNCLVKGRVVDRASGKPVKGWVEYRPFADNPELKRNPLLAQDRWPPVTINAQLDADGRFTLPALPGRGLLFARIQGTYRRATIAEADRRAGIIDKTDHELFDTRPRATWPQEYHAYRLIDATSEKTTTCDFTVDPGRSLPLVVKDPHGKSLTVRVLGLTPEPDDFSQELTAGRGTIAALAPGERRKLYVRATDRPLAGHLTLRGDETGTISLRLQPTGVLTGVLIGADGKPLAGEYLQLAYGASANHGGVFLQPGYMGHLLTTAQEARLRRVRGFPDKRPATGAEKTDTDGRFRIEGVFPDIPFDLKVQLTGPFPARKGARMVIGMVKVTSATIAPGQTKDLGASRVVPAGRPEKDITPARE